ncbi:putative HTH-type transcriptional regulator YwnA [compost metagenome]
MTSEELASSIRTNPTVIRRLIAKLVEAGLLSSFKGKAGGVKLARPAKEISLRDIYSAVLEKRLIANRNKEPQKGCPVSCAMGKLMHEVIDGIEDNSMKYMSNIRLSELSNKVPR